MANEHKKICKALNILNDNELEITFDSIKKAFNEEVERWERYDIDKHTTGTAEYDYSYQDNISSFIRHINDTAGDIRKKFYEGSKEATEKMISNTCNLLYWYLKEEQSRLILKPSIVTDYDKECIRVMSKLLEILKIR